MIKIDIEKAITDFEWIIKILESSEDENHLKVSLKCYLLWDSKYNNVKLKKCESDTLNRLRPIFWSYYKSKNNKIGLANQFI